MGMDTVILRQVVDQAIDEHPRITKMEADIEVLKSDVGTLKSDVGTLKSDVGTLKSDVGTLKSDVATLKGEMIEVKQDIRELKAEQHRQGILMEDMDRKMDRLIDALLPAKHREVQIDRLEEVMDSHEQRLGAVETAVKTHIGDRERHR